MQTLYFNAIKEALTASAMIGAPAPCALGAFLFGAPVGMSVFYFILSNL